MVIAIDGPAGAGKSTVARALAARLRFAYLDSGAMYRCVGLLALERPADDAAALARASRIELPLGAEEAGSAPGHDAGEAGSAARHGAWEVGSTAGHGAGEAGSAARDGAVWLDGRDVSALIRAPEVSQAASHVAADPRVREALVVKQRDLLRAGDWVAEGRDIGTVVAPDADLKVYLTADPAERARRRAAELGADVATVLAEQALRDERDSTLGRSTLQAAAGAVELDTTGLSIEQVVGRIVQLVRASPRSA